MKLLFAFLSLAMAVRTDRTCSVILPYGSTPMEWINMGKPCLDAMRRQIQHEINASYTYLAMGAHFSRDLINRAGFSEFFFNSAKEERDHGKKLMQYLSLRGELPINITSLKKLPTVEQHHWLHASDVLADALKLETSLSQSVRELIEICEGVKNNSTENGRNPAGKNDYHLVQYLTHGYLKEKFEKQRNLAGKLSTLKKMSKDDGLLSEFWFDFNNNDNVKTIIGS